MAKAIDVYDASITRSERLTCLWLGVSLPTLISDPVTMHTNLVRRNPRVLSVHGTAGRLGW